MKFLKAYCHSKETSESLQVPIECTEVTFHASPAALRKIAEFLIECAQRFEDGAAGTPDHLHLRDSWKAWKAAYPDVIAMQADESGAS